MFVSADFLGIQYGVDDRIARFFVDRKPPENNLYWKDKLLYLRFDPGWIFIPLMVDLLYRSGISRDQLLSEEFVVLMEKIGHISALEEVGKINKSESIEQYVNLVRDNYKCESYFQNLVNYMQEVEGNFFKNLATSYKALHRGDAFLFSLCALSFKDELQELLVKTWFALITTLLLLDDAEDIKIDKASGDENAFIESGKGADGIAGLKEMVRKNLLHLKLVNKSMAFTIDEQYKKIIEKPHIKELLNLK